VIDDTPNPATPDSIFPNNWVSFHEDGQVIIYPIFAENRRQEKRQDILDQLITENNFHVSNTTDYSYFEKESIFLEGTGSMILDRENSIVYAAISDRMHLDALKLYCLNMGFEAVVFNAMQSVDNRRVPIYHTNVMMCLGSTFAVICLDCIDDKQEQVSISNKLSETKKEIIPISEEQISQFAGNMLEVRNEENERLLVMSSSAYKSLNTFQLKSLEKHCRIIHSDISTIERLGGGSARCMMAEVFLPGKS